MENPLKCGKCPKYCKNEKTLKIHEACVHPDVLLQCDLCGLFSKSKNLIEIHFRAHINRKARGLKFESWKLPEMGYCMKY